MPKALNLSPRNCVICETEFSPAHRRAKYCSKRCLNKSKNAAKLINRPEETRAVARALYAKHREKRVASMRARSKTDRHKSLMRRIYERRRLQRPWISMIDEAKRRATRKGLAFDLTEEWAKERWTGCCELTGLPFLTGLVGAGPKNRSPSIDKLIPSLGYVQSNCRIILHCLNCLKGSGTEEEMMEVILSMSKRLGSI